MAGLRELCRGRSFHWESGSSCRGCLAGVRLRRDGRSRASGSAERLACHGAASDGRDRSRRARKSAPKACCVASACAVLGSPTSGARKRWTRKAWNSSTSDGRDRHSTAKDCWRRKNSSIRRKTTAHYPDCRSMAPAPTTPLDGERRSTGGPESSLICEALSSSPAWRLARPSLCRSAVCGFHCAFGNPVPVDLLGRGHGEPSCGLAVVQPFVECLRLQRHGRWIGAIEAGIVIAAV